MRHGVGMSGTPRQSSRYTSAAYRANGKKPMFDGDQCARIKRRNDEGVSMNELRLAYGVGISTIRGAIRRAELRELTQADRI